MLATAEGGAVAERGDAAAHSRRRRSVRTDAPAIPPEVNATHLKRLTTLLARRGGGASLLFQRVVMSTSHDSAHNSRRELALHLNLVGRRQNRTACFDAEFESSVGSVAEAALIPKPFRHASVQPRQYAILKLCGLDEPRIAPAELGEMLIAKRPLLIIRAGGTESSTMVSLLHTASSKWGAHEMDYHCTREELFERAYIGLFHHRFVMRSCKRAPACAHTLRWQGWRRCLASTSGSTAAHLTHRGASGSGDGCSKILRSSTSPPSSTPTSI